MWSWCCGKRGDSDLEAERNRHSRASIRKITPDDQDYKMIQQVEEGKGVLASRQLIALVRID